MSFLMSRETDTAILVVSCDAYQDVWQPFFHCFFKYWPDCPYPLALGANFAAYPDARVAPILIGPDLDYTSNLLKMLDHIQQEWVILWIDDRPPCAPVDTDRLVRLIKLAQSRQAAYLKLISDYPLAFVDAAEGIGEIPKGARYRTSMTVVLWHKPVLLKLLRPGETAWDIERRGSRRSDELEDQFYCLAIGIKQAPPLRNQHLIVKMRLARDARDFLEREGLLPFLEKRLLQTWRSYWYGRTYALFFDVYYHALWQLQKLKK
jgi:hypothetical protein